jgi:hypothetical protein
MSIGDALKIAFFVLLILALALAIMNYIQQASQPPQPVLAMNWPAGITYKGPDTTAIAGWYCIENINSSNYYSIQLNALLNNELGVQDAYGPSVTFNGITWQTAFLDNVWGQNFNGTPVLLHASNPINDVANAPCAWLVIALKNGYAYFGYSLNGESITWYDSYPVNATYILPSGHTGIVLAGASNGEQAQLGRGTLVYLALYYWNGTGWAPAPVGVNQGLQTGETVNHAWEFTSGECSGYVAWFGWNKTNPETLVLPSNLEPVCPTPPSFEP